MTRYFLVALILLTGCANKKMIIGTSNDLFTAPDFYHPNYQVGKKEKCQKPWIKQTTVIYESKQTYYRYDCVYQGK